MAVSQRPLRDDGAVSRAWPATQRPRTPPAAAAPRPVPLPRTWSYRWRPRSSPSWSPTPSCILGDVAPPRRPRPALDARRHAHRDRPAHRPATGPISRSSSWCSCRAVRGSTRPSAWTAWPSPIAGSASRPSGSSSATASSSTVGYALGDGSNVVEEFWTLDHDLPVRPDGAGQRRPLRGWSRSARSARPAAACRTRRGTGSTSTRTWRSPSGFLHQLFVGADFIHDPVAVAYWVAPLRRDHRAHPGLPDRPAGLAVAPSSAARRQRRHARRRASSRIYLDGPRARSPRRPLGPVLRVALPDAVTAGGGRIRSRSRRRPTASGCASPIKELGDWSKALQGVSVGTRVFVEGPYGVLTGARRTRPEGRCSSPVASGSPRCARSSRRCRRRPAT